MASMLAALEAQSHKLSHNLELAVEAQSLLPTIEVHHWMDRSARSIKLPPDFDRFIRNVRIAMGASDMSRLYWFPRAEMPIASRIEVTVAAFADFCAYARADSSPAVWVWEPTAEARSPQQLPVTATVEGPATPQQPPAPSRSSGRSSQVQRSFREGLLLRDGGSCVLCRRTPDCVNELEAAHVVRHGSSSAIMSEAALASTNDCCNGVMLCASPCHFWFDQFHWWLEPDGTVAASAAILADAGLGPHFLPLIGQTLRLPDAKLAHLWPVPESWGVQRRLSKEAEEARHAVAAGSPFECGRCGVRYKTARGLFKHGSGCRETNRRLLFTPAERSTMPPAQLATLKEAEGGSSDEDEDDAE